MRTVASTKYLQFLFAQKLEQMFKKVGTNLINMTPIVTFSLLRCRRIAGRRKGVENEVLRLFA